MRSIETALKLHLKDMREREVFYKRYAPPAPAGTSVAEVTSTST